MWKSVQIKNLLEEFSLRFLVHDIIIFISIPIFYSFILPELKRLGIFFRCIEIKKTIWWWWRLLLPLSHIPLPSLWHGCRCVAPPSPAPRDHWNTNPLPLSVPGPGPVSQSRLIIKLIKGIVRGLSGPLSPHPTQKCRLPSGYLKYFLRECDKRFLWLISAN